ncbi:MAG: hypothetical protein K0S86_5642 [Geminicoccaceae bacterium]|nr:hypothetical protein [Geminicoccaceae bacterium]
MAADFGDFAEALGKEGWGARGNAPSGVRVLTDRSNAPRPMPDPGREGWHPERIASIQKKGERMRGMSDIPPQHPRGLAPGRELLGTAAPDATVPKAGSIPDSRFPIPDCRLPIADKVIRPFPPHPRHRRSDRPARAEPYVRRGRSPCSDQQDVAHPLIPSSPHPFPRFCPPRGSRGLPFHADRPCPPFTVPASAVSKHDRRVDSRRS